MKCRFIALLGILLLFAGCATHNTSSDGTDSNLMLKGHDPVAYHTQGKPVPGLSDIKTEHEGVTYRFASTQNRDLFTKDPDKYKPQFNGFCSNGMVYAIPLGGNHDTFRIIDGKLYMFGGEGSRKYFEMDLDRNMKLATDYWNNEVKGGSARLQAWKRLMFKVPHYKTNRELAAEYEARQGKGGNK